MNGLSRPAVYDEENPQGKRVKLDEDDQSGTIPTQIIAENG